MMRYGRLTSVAAIVTALILLGCGQGAGRTLQNKDQDETKLVGKKAPDIQGSFVASGKPGSLADFKGKVILLDFWAVWCGPCIATFPHLREWHKEFHDQGLVVLGTTRLYQRFGFDRKSGKLTQVGKFVEKQLVGGLTPEKEKDMLKEFASYHKLEHNLLVLESDAWRKATKDYNIEGIPTLVLIDRQGIVRLVRVGADEENVQAVQAEIKNLLAQK
jgi:thiol-disulfide isomerase/thioredoxin